MSSGLLRAPLSLIEAQSIGESVVGSVQWNGPEGYCACPGIAQHTSGNASTDCKVVVERTAANVAPGVYCFHQGCAAAVEPASRQVRSLLGKRCPSDAPRVFQMPRPQRPKPVFDPEKLEQIARKLDGFAEEDLHRRSPKRPDTRTPVSFLHELTEPEEKIVVFSDEKSQGQALWANPGFPFNATALDAFRCGALRGVWFLANPVSGEFALNDRGVLSRRSWQTVTSFRYMLLESDRANPAHWLAALAQMPLPISAIYTSGGRSIHALVRLGASSKEQWDARADRLKPAMVTLGGDEKAMSAVRLTRLPCCERVEKGQMQRLLYLNGNPDGTPICEQEVRS